MNQILGPGPLAGRRRSLSSAVKVRRTLPLTPSGMWTWGQAKRAFVSGDGGGQQLHTTRSLIFSSYRISQW